MTVIHSVIYKDLENLNELRQNVYKNFSVLEERFKDEIPEIGIGVHLNQKTINFLKEQCSKEEFINFIKEFFIDEIEVILGESKEQGLEFAFYKYSDMFELEEDYYNFKYVNLTLKMQFMNFGENFSSFEKLLKEVNDR